MFKFRKNKAQNYPPEVVTNLDELMRFEYLVQVGNILPAHPVYSLLAGRHASKLRGRGLDFEEVRQYVAGDDIRNIDWKVTARTGVTHSKVFNEEKERPTFIVVDQSATMFFGSQRFVKSVTAAHAAALSAFYTLKRGDRSGGLVFNEEGYDYISPKRSKSLVQHFLQCIVERNKILPLRKTVSPNTSLLNKMLQRTRSSITHDYVVTVISDFSMIDAETKMNLRNISYHNDVILVHVFDPMDAGLPDGKLLLSDGKRQIEWKNDRHNWGKRFSDDFIRSRNMLQEEFRHYKIPMVFLSTALPVEEQVTRLYG